MSGFVVRLKSTDVSEGSAASIINTTITINQCTLNTQLYIILFYVVRFFYVLLTVHLSIILVIDQLNAQILVL